jgi:iron complex transport system permease protein
MMMSAIVAVYKDYRRIAVLTALSLCLIGITLFSLTVGAVSIPLTEIAFIFLKRLAPYSDLTVEPLHDVVINAVRLPRICMTLLIGGSLGLSGACLQGLFRNPLVEPSLIGVSGGSAMMVVLVIVFGGALRIPTTAWTHDIVLSLAAFAGGIGATFLVLTLSKKTGRTNIAVLILVGVAINALAGAVIGMAIFYADENQLRTFTFWTLGDLGGASWNKLAIVTPLLTITNGWLLLFARSLNAFALGESDAFHMGVDTEVAKRAIVILISLSVGVSVSLAGMIGFVGLIVPHVVRMSFFPDNRLVLPASMLGGALLLVVADIIARTVVLPAELPIGVVTALIGSPFFIVLLINAHRKNEL